MDRRSFFATSIVTVSIAAVFFCSYSPASAFSIGNFNFDSGNLPQWIQDLLGQNGDGSAPCNDTTDSAPAVVQTIPGYTPNISFVTYPIPSGSTGRAPGITDSIKEAWYPDMISPGKCDGFEQGVCLSPDFPSPQGTHIAAITAIPQITSVVPTKDVLIFPATFVDQTIKAQTDVDLVSYQKRDSCGANVTRWGYAVAQLPVLPPNTKVMVPKNIPIDVNYSCQPNQELHWRTDQPCAVIFGVKIGKCNVRDHVRTFLFSNEFLTNIDSQTSVLGGQFTTVLDGTADYTLSCGGYKQENGTTDNTEPPIHNYQSSSGGVCILGIDCNTGGDSGVYGVADPSYQHPGLALFIASCTNDDEIVINNVCTPCSTLKAGSHRSGNICVINTVPIATLNAGKGDGVPVTVPLGTKVTITATYTAGQGDTLAATAINDNSTGSTVSCNSILPFSSTCWQQPDPQKVYSYTPTTLGTKTFSAQIKTDAYTNYQSAKTVSVTATCPAGSVANGSSACTCTGPNFTWVGSSCVLSCPKGLVPNSSGGACIVAPKLPSDITFTATRARTGSPSTLSFTIAGMVNGIVCGISPTPASGQISWDHLATWIGTAQTAPITASTVYTMSCTNTLETIQKSVTVQLVPQFQEI